MQSLTAEDGPQVWLAPKDSGKPKASVLTFSLKKGCTGLGEASKQTFATDAELFEGFGKPVEKTCRLVCLEIPSLQAAGKPNVPMPAVVLSKMAPE